MSDLRCEDDPARHLAELAPVIVSLVLFAAGLVANWAMNAKRLSSSPGRPLPLLLWSAGLGSGLSGLYFLTLACFVVGIQVWPRPLAHQAVAGAIALALLLLLMATTTLVHNRRVMGASSR